MTTARPSLASAHATSVAPCAPISTAPSAPAPVAEWSSRVAVDDVLTGRDVRANEQRFPKRCTLGASARLRFSLGATPFATLHAAPLARDEVVIDEGQDDVRIVTGDERVRLIAFVAREDLRAVTTERVGLTARASDVASDAPIRVAGGVAVDGAETEGDLRRVHLEIDGVEVFGWLPAEKIGTTFTPRPPPRAAPIDGELAWGASVVDARGDVLAKFPPSPSEALGAASGTYVELGPVAPNGQRAIVWMTDRIEVHGLVAAALVRPRPATSLHAEVGSAAGSAGFESDMRPVTLAAGASLFTSEGFRVGTVLRRADAFSGNAGSNVRSELRGVDVDVGSLGFVSLYARASDVAPR
jgi:hypothetical protein